MSLCQHVSMSQTPHTSSLTSPCVTHTDVLHERTDARAPIFYIFTSCAPPTPTKTEAAEKRNADGVEGPVCCQHGVQQRRHSRRVDHMSAHMDDFFFGGTSGASTLGGTSCLPCSHAIASSISFTSCASSSGVSDSGIESLLRRV